MEAILETKAETILQFIRGLRSSLYVVFEEGTWAAWLHDLLKPHVTRVVVCDTRKTGLGKHRNRNDRDDARGLARLLYRNELEPVYHGEHGLRTLRELARTYLAITRDLTRVMTRVKAIYRSWGIPCAGQQVYALRHRAEWLGKLAEEGVHRRAGFYYQQFDALAALRQQARHEVLLESRKHSAVTLLRQIPSIGPIRAALLVALLQTPHRFRTKRQLWAYIGLALRTYTSGEYRFEGGQLKRSKKGLAIRGLNRNYNHDRNTVEFQREEDDTDVEDNEDEDHPGNLTAEHRIGPERTRPVGTEINWLEDAETILSDVTKTEAGLRDIDLHPSAARILRNFIGSRKSGYLFQTANGTMLDPGNIDRDSLSPILDEMGRAQVGTRFNVFRRFREAVLQRSEARQILIDYWMGHSNPSMGDRYGRQLVEDVEYRQDQVKKVGLGFDLPPSLFGLRGLQTLGNGRNEEAA
jgi:transposase